MPPKIEEPPLFVSRDLKHKIENFKLSFEHFLKSNDELEKIKLSYTEIQRMNVAIDIFARDFGIDPNELNVFFESDGSLFVIVRDMIPNPNYDKEHVEYENNVRKQKRVERLNRYSDLKTLIEIDNPERYVFSKNKS